MIGGVPLVAKLVPNCSYKMIYHKLIELSKELMKDSMPNGEFTSWVTSWSTLTADGDFTMKGNLTTKEYHGVHGDVVVTYYGCTFTISVGKETANWGFDTKCDSQLYTIPKTKESGDNWSGYITPILHRSYDKRVEWKDKVETAILESI